MLQKHPNTLSFFLLVMACATNNRKKIWVSRHSKLSGRLPADAARISFPSWNENDAKQNKRRELRANMPSYFRSNSFREKKEDESDCIFLRWCKLHSYSNSIVLSIPLGGQKTDSQKQPATRPQQAQEHTIIRCFTRRCISSSITLEPFRTSTLRLMALKLLGKTEDASKGSQKATTAVGLKLFFKLTLCSASWPTSGTSPSKKTPFP